MHIQAIEVMDFTLQEMKVGMFKTLDNEFFVYNFCTGKISFCLGLPHAAFVFEGCVNNIKRVFGIGAETNKYS